MKSAPVSCVQRGFSMIEVLVTIVILAVGLLGLAALQARLQLSEMEAYQRAQALILLNDMASRIAANRNNAAAYATAAPITVSANTTPLGAGVTCPAVGTVQQTDIHEWCEALQGAAETTASGNVGAMLGGRGCVEDIGNWQYMITVAWQGLTPISEPPDAVACGAGLYTGGSSCTGDLCRRYVTTIISIPPL